MALLHERRLLPDPYAGGVLPWPPTPGPDLLHAYRGAIVGGAVGDALGRPAESRSRAAVLARFERLDDFRPWRGWSGGPVGTFTDDTQLTLEVARCLAANDGRIDPADLAARLVAWLPDARGAGRATRAAVRRLGDEPWWRAGVDSAGNGAAMRAAPIGLAHIADVDQLRVDAALAAVVTHAHPMAVVSAIAHAWLVAALAAVPAGSLRVDQLVDGLVDVIEDLADPGEPERDWPRRPGKTGQPVRLVDRLAEVPSWLDAEIDDALAHFYNGAFVLESLPAALWFFLRRPEDPEAVIVEAAMGGRDADTVASMAGAYVGAHLGLAALPLRWTGPRLEARDELVALAGELYGLAIGPHGPWAGTGRGTR
jgi:ADP-ribosylglycohydrolase